MVDSVSQNQNTHSNAGKVVGTGVGLALGAGNAYLSCKSIDNVDKFINSDLGKKFMASENMADLKDLLSKSDLFNKRFYSTFLDFFSSVLPEPDRINNLKNSMKITVNYKSLYVVAPVIMLSLAGLGFGAIVDHFRNKK